MPTRTVATALQGMPLVFMPRDDNNPAAAPVTRISAWATSQRQRPTGELSEPDWHHQPAHGRLLHTSSLPRRPTGSWVIDDSHRHRPRDATPLPPMSVALRIVPRRLRCSAMSFVVIENLLSRPTRCAASNHSISRVGVNVEILLVLTTAAASDFNSKARGNF